MPNRSPAAVIALACALGFPAALPAVAADAAQADHAAMDHAAHDMTPDELGRTMYGMKHEMDPAMMNELRQKVPLYRGYSDAALALSMDNMGPEYAWYISPPGLKSEQGLLVLMHGFRDPGDRIFRDRVQPLGNIFPTALGVGMAMMMSMHIQVALDQLVAAGAKQIIVLPVVSSESNELYRQWLYVFGKLDRAEFASVPRVKTSAAVRIMPPPGDNPLVAEILLDYAREISTDPKNEVVIIAGHGPTSAEDNAEELKNLASLARLVQEDGHFAAVQGATLQDDSPPEVRAANVARLRAMVQGAAASGKRVLVVTNLIGARTIQAKLREDLKGLDYKFNSKGIVEHDNFIKWMRESVRTAVEKQAALCC